MIVYKTWTERRSGGLIRYHWEGWFLFGFIPLYLKRGEVKQ
jgi:hypothetical protein